MIPIAAIDPQHLRFVGDAFAEAQRRAGLKADALAALCEVSHQRLSKWKQGEENPHLGRLMNVIDDPHGKAFWRFFLIAFAKRVGFDIEEELVREAFREAVDKVQVRMLRAELTQREHERRTA